MKISNAVTMLGLKWVEDHQAPVILFATECWLISPSDFVSATCILLSETLVTSEITRRAAVVLKNRCECFGGRMRAFGPLCSHPKRPLDRARLSRRSAFLYRWGSGLTIRLPQGFGRLAKVLRESSAVSIHGAGFGQPAGSTVLGQTQSAWSVSGRRKSRVRFVWYVSLKMPNLRADQRR